MASTTLTAAELMGRIVSLEALVIALSAEVLASQPDDKAAGLFAGVRAVAHATVEDLTPALAPRSPVMKELADAANAYVESNVDRIARARARILRDGAMVKPE